MLVHTIYSIPSEVWLYYESMFHLAYVLCGPVRAGAVHKVVSISDQLSWLSTGFLGSLRLRIPDRTRPTTTAAYARCAQTQMHWHSYTPTSIQYFQLTWNIFAKNVSFPLPWKQGGEGGVGLGNLWGKQKHCVTKFRADIDGFELPSSKKQQHLQLIKYISTELPLCVRIFPLASYRTSLNGAPSRSLLRLI